ncbi:hypothetical protein RHMOL_Rhmol08G0185600 [Rhododendron molle]|uniref:Uncharacterized protein n=1 Tax=Rhododendron molle TaxID=49168 RepID=A0ACC0MPP6_RHOML|nr:hypothetical protein RHMOL_Rhmol08G0185600 [Rhododendron molle]
MIRSASWNIRGLNGLLKQNQQDKFGVVAWNASCFNVTPVLCRIDFVSVSVAWCCFLCVRGNMYVGAAMLLNISYAGRAVQCFLNQSTKIMLVELF